MKMDAELNSQNPSASLDVERESQASESSATSPQRSETATLEAAESGASGQSSVAACAPGEAKATVAERVASPVEADGTLPAVVGGNNPAGAAQVAIPSPDVSAGNPLGDALAALDRKDYATAKRLFEAIGRKDAAEAIDNALAALDRKDYAAAQGLFEALSPPKPAASAGPAASIAPAASAGPAAPAKGPMTSEPRAHAQSKSASPLEVIPPPDGAYRGPAPQAKRMKERSSRPLWLRAGLALIAIVVALAIYAPRPNWTFAAAKSQAVAGLASTVDLIKAPLAEMTGSSEREEERSKMREFSAALAQATIRLNQLEQDYGERVDKLGESVDQKSSSRLAEISAKLDALERKAAAPTPASELASVVARLDALEKKAAAPAMLASEIAGIVARLDKLESGVVARLDKLEKRTALQAVSSATPLPPPAPRKSTAMGKAERSASNEIARLDGPAPLLRDYSVEDVHGGVAMVGSRHGVQEVAPGDLIPGAGRVLRIERRGGDWFVLTNRGVIASSAAPYE